jgi:uncharacterized protein
MPVSRQKFKKFQDLLHELHALGRVAVAFSGGLDSTLLLYAARQALQEDDVLAITCVAVYIPQAEIEEAKRTAAAFDVRHRLIAVPFPEELRANPLDRCYLCKRALLTHMAQAAADAGISHLVDGTNLDDLRDYRPGRRALEEFGVKSPLLAAGLTKQDIRDLARENGLVWDKPAGACLLTRIPHGRRIDFEELKRIDLIEDFLKDQGFATVRLRSHGELASIEVPVDQVSALIEADRRHGIDARIKALGYRHVTVDLAGYRMGGLNEQPSRQETAAYHEHAGNVEAIVDRRPKRQPGRGERDGAAAGSALPGPRPHQDRPAPRPSKRLSRSDLRRGQDPGAGRGDLPAHA